MVCSNTESNKLEVVTIKIEMKGNESLIYGFICQPINLIMDVQ